MISDRTWAKLKHSQRWFLSFKVACVIRVFGQVLILSDQLSLNYLFNAIKTWKNTMIDSEALLAFGRAMILLGL